MVPRTAIPADGMQHNHQHRRRRRSQEYFETHAAERQLLRHDKALHKAPQPAALKHLPAYLKDPALITTDAVTHVSAGTRVRIARGAACLKDPALITTDAATHVRIRSAHARVCASMLEAGREGGGGACWRVAAPRACPCARRSSARCAKGAAGAPRQNAFAPAPWVRCSAGGADSSRAGSEAHLVFNRLRGTVALCVWRRRATRALGSCRPRSGASYPRRPRRPSQARPRPSIRPSKERCRAGGQGALTRPQPCRACDVLRQRKLHGEARLCSV